MPTQVIRLQDLPFVLRRHLARDRKGLVKVAGDTMELAREYARDMAEDKDLVFSGDYKRGFSVGRFPMGAVLENVSAYAHVIEYGRRPGARMPPHAPIYQWVTGKLGLEGRAAKAMTWHVRKQIHLRGMPPHRIMQFTSAWALRIFRVKAKQYLRTRGGTGF